MSQVIIEFAKVGASAEGRDTPVVHYIAVSEEITTSDTSQVTTALTTEPASNSIVTVINNGTDAIWVNFGAAAAAASPSRFIAPNTTRDFNNVPEGTTVSVINDS